MTTIPETVSAVDGRPASADSGPRYYSRFSAPQRFLHGFLARDVPGPRHDRADASLQQRILGGCPCTGGGRIRHDSFLSSVLRRSLNPRLSDSRWQSGVSNRFPQGIRPGLGVQLHGPEFEGHSRLHPAAQVVLLPRAETDVRPLCLLGQSGLLGGLLGHGDHRSLRICHVVCAVLRQTSFPARG